MSDFTFTHMSWSNQSVAAFLGILSVLATTRKPDMKNSQWCQISPKITYKLLVSAKLQGPWASLLVQLHGDLLVCFLRPWIKENNDTK